MKLKELTVADWAALLAVLVALLVAVAGVVWNQRNARIEDLEAQLSLFQDTEGWTLPETVRQLDTVTDELQLTIEERDQLNELQERIPILEQANQDLEATIEPLELELQKLSDEVGFILSEPMSATIWSQ